MVYIAAEKNAYFINMEYNTGDHFEVAESDLKWVCDWIKKADKEY